MFVVFVVAWSVWELYPLQSRNLIDEFQRRAVTTDTNFTAIVEEARKLSQAETTTDFQALRQAIGTNDVTRYFPFVRIPKAEKDANLAVLHRLQRDAAGEVKLGLDLQGGTEFLVKLDTSKMDTNRLSQFEEREFVVSQAIDVLRKRVDKFGVAEPIIQPAGEDTILIQLPGLSEAEKQSARVQLTTSAVLEFRLVHPDSNNLLSQGLTAPGYDVLHTTRERNGQEEQIPYLVKRKTEKGLTGKYVSRAMVVPDPISNQPEISLRFNTEGARLFSDITRENVGQQLAIVLDGELYSAPVIQEPIPGGEASISGDFTIKEAYGLANVLENPLETPVGIEREMSVEPSLGKDSIRSGIRAAIIGTVLVAAFMLVYYLFAGLVANVALLLNIIVLLGVLASVDTTLTLPGIAGIVLTIGMAVDANVLIFERIREEFAAGKSVRGAVSAGYDKAFSTIFDANVTTLIASVILIFLGTGPVKGFGVTLTIGVAASMFTALVVTRLIFDFLINKGILKSVPMLRLIGETKIDFLRFSKPAFALSWALVLVGTVYGIYRGRETLGVEFAGGDRISLSFAQRVDVEKVRSEVNALKFGEPMIQYQKDLSGGGELLQVTTAYGKGNEVLAHLQQQFPDAKFNQVGGYNVGPAIGTQILKTAVIAVLLSLLGILVYVALRYEFSFALGAVIAVVHDVLMTLGWFCLTGREFSAPMVAAVLTIIGFSINDTIVIFDRIREDLKLGIRGSFKDVINKALNQTLSRTIITSGTVFLSTAALYAFGGPVINDFAFTFLVGILTGTYSSIYIASAFILWWHKGERPRTSTQVVLDQPAAARA